MDAVKNALKGQYHAGLAMLRECVEVCPDNLWVAGTFPRNTWRIAYHAAFYAHLYMMQRVEDFVAWDRHDEGATDLWADANPPRREPYTRDEVIAYVDQVDGLVDRTIDSLDLASQDSGFPWYKDFPKLDHVILSIRHIGVHVGQLEELLDAGGVDFNWISRRPPLKE